MLGVILIILKKPLLDLIALYKIHKLPMEIVLVRVKYSIKGKYKENWE